MTPLLDTGADVTVLPSVAGLEPAGTSIEIEVAGGIVHTAAEQYICWIRLDGLLTRVVALAGDAMLGRDVIIRYRCQVNLLDDPCLEMTRHPEARDEGE